MNFDQGLTAQSQAAMNIYDGLADAGIKIPFPQTDLHVKSFDPTIQKTIIPFSDDKKDKGSNNQIIKPEK